MAPVVDTPILQHIFGLLSRHNITDAYVNIHYLADTLLKAYGEGYIVVGRDAVVGRGVSLLGDVTVGTDCWVRPNATIKSSILLPGASVGDGAYLEDCIVGHGYDVRPGETIRSGALMRRAR